MAIDLAKLVSTVVLVRLIILYCCDFESLTTTILLFLLGDALTFLGVYHKPHLRLHGTQKKPLLGYKVKCWCLCDFSPTESLTTTIHLKHQKHFSYLETPQLFLGAY